MINFAIKIKRLREATGKSQSKVCRDLDLGVGLWSHYEKGQTIPSLEKAVRIADYFGVTLDELVGRDDTQERQKVQDTATLKDFMSILSDLIVLMQYDRRTLIGALRDYVAKIAQGLPFPPTETPEGREVVEIIKRSKRAGR